MPSAIDQGEATRLCNAMLGLGYTAPTLPIKARLVTTMGTVTAAGTEVVNSGGSTYTPQNFVASSSSPSPNTATTGVVANSVAAIVFSNMPDTSGVTGVKGVELWDSAATPVRKMLGTLAQTKITALGDSLTFATSQLSAQIQSVLV
jgi:hypothetical protein